MGRGTDREHDNHFALSFDNHSKIVAHFEPLERFVDEDVLDLRRRDEARGRRAEVGTRSGGRLDAQRPEDKERLFCDEIRNRSGQRKDTAVTRSRDAAAYLCRNDGRKDTRPPPTPAPTAASRTPWRRSPVPVHLRAATADTDPCGAWHRAWWTRIRISPPAAMSSIGQSPHGVST